ncbi:hypothetical protein [Tomitella cavernea]|uniref:hypothetical protein n=1 Tax=Tomitella cavernea TaxID=1387982 RepID=UPI001906744F|nr:hypothetical protein [Tomitella cavernea]
MTTAAEFRTLAREIEVELLPALGSDWADLVRGEARAGEHLAAVDDALQGAAVGGLAVTRSLAARVERVISLLPSGDPDRERLSGWLARLPRKQDSAA